MRDDDPSVMLDVSEGERAVMRAILLCVAAIIGAAALAVWFAAK